MTQHTLDLRETGAPNQRARHEMEERMAELGIRPPTRYEVTPEDLAPPVPTRSRFVALVMRAAQLFR